MIKYLKTTCCFASALAAAFASAQFTENFDVDHTANWAFNSSIAGDLPSNNSGTEANFFFDYSTVGIPSAPGSGGTTRGLKLMANVPGTSVFSGGSVSPLGLNLTGDYKLSFYAWENFVGPGPGGGSGSTQLTGGGIMTNGTTNEFQGGSYNGLGFVASGDGNTNPDYRVYDAPGAPVTGVLSAPSGSGNASDPYYAGFQGAFPAAQTALYPGQSGTIQAGALGEAWRKWEITKIGDVVTWDVDGLQIASVDTSTVANFTNAGGNIFFSQADINSGSSTDPNANALEFGLIDNVSVAPVPEPASFAVLGLGLLAFVRRRARR
jgi:MYXO-CTERM domain-containing protein